MTSFLGAGRPVPKILKMPNRNHLDRDGEGAQVLPGPSHPALPDADEEHTSVEQINKWISLADSALQNVPKRKQG